MAFYVYVLRSLKDGRFYIGMTNDLRRHLEQHHSGKVRSTRNRRPLILIYTESYSHRADAAKRERFLKAILAEVVPTSSQ